MRGFEKFMLFMGFALLIISFVYQFSETFEAVLNSIIVGIFVFVFSVLILENFIPKLKHEDGGKIPFWVYLTAFILMIIAVLIFLNFFLYVKALLGNDMFISLNSKNKSLVMENGNEELLDISARVLTSPFCNAECIMSVEDLSDGVILYNESLSLSVSSPFSKSVPLKVNEETYGQKLYKVYFSCQTKKENLCHTKTDSKKSRTQIISVVHNLNEFQKENKERLKNESEYSNNKFGEISFGLEKINLNLSSINFSYLEPVEERINNSLAPFKIKINLLNRLYSSQEYSYMDSESKSILNEIENLSKDYELLNNSFYSDLNIYNSIVENIYFIHDEIAFLEDYNFSNYSVELAESFVTNFNYLTLNIDNKSTVSEKLILMNTFYNEKDFLNSVIEDEKSSGVLKDKKINTNFLELNLTKLNLLYVPPQFNFSLPEPEPICCFEGECYSCINNKSSNYPVILLHGHSFNEKLSVEASFEAMSSFSSAFESEGYLDSGILYLPLSEGDLEEGSLGRINRSVVIKGTYYLDPLERGDAFSLDARWSNIDTYSSRLNEIVSGVKYITGKEKVIIVAHSMGGLVTRRYLEIYGENDVSKVILIGTPNNGVDGFVLNYCSVFGADVECEEMGTQSSFITSLNENSPPTIKIHNFVGLGCFWENSYGDGIVKNESAYLPYAENVFLEGECKGLDFFHGELVNAERYPEIYEAIKEKIKS